MQSTQMKRVPLVSLYSLSVFLKFAYQFLALLSNKPKQPRPNGFMSGAFLSSNLTEADEAWSRVNLGHGLVALDRALARNEGLAPSRAWPPDRTKEVYSFAVYHAMHCLVRLKQHVCTLLSLTLSKATVRMYVKEFILNDDPSKQHHISHAYHCINIIRNELMCNADGTLLAAPLAPSHREKLPIGEGETRTCTNWAYLRDWAVGDGLNR